MPGNHRHVYVALQSTGAQSKRRSRDNYSNRAYSRTQTVRNTGTHNLPLYLTRPTIRTNDVGVTACPLIVVTVFWNCTIMGIRRHACIGFGTFFTFRSDLAKGARAGIYKRVCMSAKFIISFGLLLLPSRLRPNFPAAATTPISKCATRSAAINTLHPLVRASFCLNIKCKLRGVVVKARPVSCGFVAVLPRHSRTSPTAKQHGMIHPGEQPILIMSNIPEICVSPSLWTRASQEPIASTREQARNQLRQHESKPGTNCVNTSLPSTSLRR